jgi:hypothetical protein
MGAPGSPGTRAGGHFSDPNTIIKKVNRGYQAMAQSTHTLYRCDRIQFYGPDSSVMVCTPLTIRL